MASLAKSRPSYYTTILSLRSYVYILYNKVKRNKYNKNYNIIQIRRFKITEIT